MSYLQDLTNPYELGLFYVLSCIDVALIVRISLNFYKLRIIRLTTKQPNLKLQCINSILMLAGLINFVSHLQQIVRYEADQERKDQNLYFTLQFTFLYSYDLAILVSSKTLFSIIQLKYEGSRKEKQIKVLKHICSLLIVLVTIVYTVDLILYFCFNNDNDLEINSIKQDKIIQGTKTNLNYASIIIMTGGVGVMFSISSWFFSRHILTLHVMRSDLRKMIVVGTYFIIMSSFLRTIWSSLQVFDTVRVWIDEWKGFDTESLINKGPTWAIFLFFYQCILNYLPILYLILLYSPYIEQTENRQTSIMAQTIQQTSNANMSDGLLGQEDLDVSRDEATDI